MTRKRFAALAALAIVGGTLAAGGCKLSSTNPKAAFGVEEGTEPAPCKTAADCPATGNPCVTGVCVDDLCRAQVVAKDTKLSKQTSGDCKKLVCDGRGYAVSRPDDKDQPPDDDNECTKESCGGGTAQSDWVDVGAACGDHGVCNGAGVCGVCLPGKKQCAGNGVATCAPSGQWSSPAACPPTTPACGGAATCIAVSQVAVGASHSCARLADGTVRCWGGNAAHQLGDVAPVRVTGLAAVAEVALGGAHACARLGDGAVSCWGLNAYGELGDGSTEARSAPVAVADVSSAAQLALGKNHTCARLSDGGVKCWGRNDEGQLGDGTSNRGKQPASAIAPAAPAGRPAMVTPSLGGVAELALGALQTCARLTDGGVSCWGASPAALVPVGGSAPDAPASRPKPTAVRGLKNAAEVAAGDAHTCARLLDGTVKCWGLNTSGQLGDGTNVSKAAPTPVKGLKDVVAISAGATHTCARIGAGPVVCWGKNDAGQLGDGTTEDRKAPTPVLGLVGASSVVLGGGHGCGQIAGGAVQCWGRNAEGELGDGTTSNRNTPTFVRW